MTSAPPHSVTWEKITSIEPVLRKMYDEARAVSSKGNPYFCANRVWYEEFKPRLERLVGWDARHEELQTMEAYDIAYQTIYRQLPACRECICL